MNQSVTEAPGVWHKGRASLAPCKPLPGYPELYDHQDNDQPIEPADAPAQAIAGLDRLVQGRCPLPEGRSQGVEFSGGVLRPPRHCRRECADLDTQLDE